MLLSIAAIFITGLLSSWLCKKLKFPALFGMILAGIAIGPYGLCLLDSSILSISAELRRPETGRPPCAASMLPARLF